MRKPVWSHGIDTRECGEQVAEHYDTAVVNFAGIKYPLKIYSGGKSVSRCSQRALSATYNGLVGYRLAINPLWNRFSRV